MTTCTNCDHPAADHLGREFGGGCAPALTTLILNHNSTRQPRNRACDCPGLVVAA